MVRRGGEEYSYEVPYIRSTYYSYSGGKSQARSRERGEAKKGVEWEWWE